MIMRGGGTCGREAIGIPGRTAGACGGVTEAVGAEARDVAAGRCAGGGTATGLISAGLVSACFGGCGGGTVNVRRTPVSGTIKRGGASGTPGETEVVGLAAEGGATAIFVSVGGWTGETALAAGVAAGGGCCRLMIAFSTSPGREICDKSILVSISSLAGRLWRVVRAGAGASAPERKCARTLRASSSSRELECVFFSVTPTSRSTSRIALLLTSNSLARSLIRILLIRPFFLYPGS